ncbi:MAG: glycosyltransferase [Opitutaceae bacterium]|nr:glycosyltransferase [Opitutaceae bacterium]
MQLSFVIPLYNCLALTQAMVASLQATVPASLAYEIILVDDGSTDGTRAWLAGLLAPFRVVLHERNLGYAAANNHGAALARGEFLVLLNNDLVLAPGWLNPMLAAHRSLGERAGLIGNVQLDARTGKIDHAGIFINLKGKPQHYREFPVEFSHFFTTVYRVDALTGACALITRALWQQLGGFDEGFRNGCEDVDLCFRARAAGRINAVALRSVVRHHISSAIDRKRRDEENTYRFARRWRHELAACAARRWCRHYFESSPLEPRDHGYRFEWQIWLHALGLRRTPPAKALVAMDAAIGFELARWDTMFGK